MAEDIPQEPAAPPKPLFPIAEGGVTINIPVPTGGPTIISRESIVETFRRDRR